MMYTYRIIYLSYYNAITSHLLYKPLNKETSYLKSHIRVHSKWIAMK